MFEIKDKKILNLLHKTLLFSFAICLLGILIVDMLLEYEMFLNLYEISIIVFRTGLFIGISSIMSSLIVYKYE
jgi:hypothetical protein